MTTLTACQVDPHRFDVDRKMTDAQIAACINDCRDCPMLGPCKRSLADMLANGVKVHGVIAGQYRPRPRTTGRSPGRPKAPCGTVTAFYRHIRLGEPVDVACRTAARRNNAAGQAQAVAS